MSKYRKPMSRRTSKRKFRRGAVFTRRENLRVGPMRGGIRL